MGDLALWVSVPSRWDANSEYLTVPRPQEAVSQEEPSVELELFASASAAPGLQVISAYALYYVCEDVYGACLYRRQDLSINVEILPAQASSR